MLKQIYKARLLAIVLGVTTLTFSGCGKATEPKPMLAAQKAVSQSSQTTTAKGTGESTKDTPTKPENSAMKVPVEGNDSKPADPLPKEKPASPEILSNLKPETLLKVGPDDGLYNGNGVSLDRISPAYPSPFKPSKQRSSNIDPNTSTSLYIVTSQEAIDQLAGINVGMKARYVFASIEGKFSKNTASTVSKNSFALVLVGRADYGADELESPELSDKAQSLINAGKMREFMNTYGTHAVIREHRAAQITLIISIDGWTEQTKDAVSLALKGRASLPIGGGELEAAIQNELKNASARKAVNVKMSCLGGEGLSQFSDIVAASLSKDGDVEAVMKSVANTLSGFKRQNAGISSVTVAPLTQFGWDPSKISLWNERYEAKLLELSERYQEARKTELQLKKFAKAESLVSVLPADLKAYGAYVEALVDLHEELMSQRTPESLKKELPTEPTLSPVTTKALLQHASGLRDELNRTAIITGTGKHDEKIVLPAGTTSDDYHIQVFASSVAIHKGRCGPIDGNDIDVHDDALLGFEVKAILSEDKKSFKLHGWYRYKWNTNPGGNGGITTQIYYLNNVTYILIRKQK